VSDEALRALASASESRHARVRALRGRVESQPNASLVTGRADLLELLSPPAATEVDPEDDLDRDPVRYAETLLAQHGLAASPPLVQAEAEQVEIATTPRFALQGAVVAAVLITLAGFWGYWLYGLLYLAATAAGVLAVGLGFHAIRRWAPEAVPSGRLLGAGTVVLFAVVITLAGVLPIRSHREDIGKAQTLVVSADKLIDQGKFDAAQAQLFAAEKLVANPPLIDDVRAHLIVAQVKAAMARQTRALRSRGG
jgi:hypothetical protein